MKKEEVIASRVPVELLDDLKKLEQAEDIDRSTAIRKLLTIGLIEWKLQHSARLYRTNKLTLATAAQEAGVPVREMMGYLRQRKNPIQYGIDDFETDLGGIYSRLDRR